MTREEAMDFVDNMFGLVEDSNKHDCIVHGEWITQKNSRIQYNHLMTNDECSVCHTKTADVVEVVHGEWIKITDVDIRLMGRQIKEVHYKCSVCGGESCFDTNYCPHCGAKMDGGE